MTSRDAMLGRIRAALAGEHATGEEEVRRDYRRQASASRAQIADEFAERVAEYRASVIRVPQNELPSAIASACEKRAVRTLVVPADAPQVWIPESIRALRDGEGSHLSKEELDASDGVLTGCALGIAQTGTIVLDGGPVQGRRIISLLPDFHLCVVYEEQIVGLVPEAIARLEEAVRQDGRAITFISGPSATSDIELSRVEGVHGPRTLNVLLVSR